MGSQHAAAAAPRWRSVALPTEHGGWSLTAEPALLGLLVAWSWSGLALGVAATLAFVARAPLKLVLVDRWRRRWLDRTSLAARIAAAELALLAGLVALALVAADAAFWPPLALALPLIGLELWFDMRSRSRRLLPELAGSIGIGAVACAIALAGGAEAEVAWGLWAVIAARSIAAVPHVRFQILRTRSRPGKRWHSDVAQVAALAVAMGSWLGGLVPAAAVVAIAALAVAAVVAVRLPPRPAKVIGIQQLVSGLAIVVITAVAVVMA